MLDRSFFCSYDNNSSKKKQITFKTGQKSKAHTNGKIIRMMVQILELNFIAILKFFSNKKIPRSVISVWYNEFVF